MTGPLVKYLSTQDTNSAGKLSLVLNFSLTCPLNSSFLSTKSMQTMRTSSPRYIPEIIFSNLKKKEKLHRFPTSSTMDGGGGEGGEGILGSVFAGFMPQVS